VIVTWAPHDVLTTDCTMYHVYARVLDTMSPALAMVLVWIGWRLEPLGEADIYVVTEHRHGR
jgi:hypothetical protein